MTSTEIATNRRMTEADLADITSFEAAIERAKELYGSIVTASDELGSGFAVLNKDDKMRLVGVPFFLLSWSFNLGDNGEFVSAVVVTGKHDRYIVNDGSTGIYDQLRRESAGDPDNGKPGRDGGMLAERGLRVSPYATCAECDRPLPEDQDVCTSVLSNGSTCGYKGKERHKAHTFYIDTAASV